MVLGQLLAVVGVKIPLPAFRFSEGIHQHSVLGPHCPVKILQTVRLFAFEEIGQFRSVGVEMFRVSAFCFHALCFALGRQRLQGFVQSVLIRLLPAKAAGAHLLHKAVDIRGERLFVIRVVEREVMDAMSQFVQPLREQPHGAEKGHDLLDVVPSVIRFRADFHHHEQPRRHGAGRNPTVVFIQLIAANQRDFLGGLGIPARGDGFVPIHDALVFLHRSEQYFTSSQQRSHFLRQENGRWQTTQVLSGGKWLRRMGV